MEIGTKGIRHDYQEGCIMKCSVENCHREEKRGRHGMCGMHYLRWWRSTLDTPRKKGVRQITQNGYVSIPIDGVKVLEHRHLAEKALGRPLPSGVQVHHMNGNKTDNFTPYNLVICPDQEYHQLLHKRAKELGYENN